MKNFFIINKVAGTKQGEQIVKEQVEKLSSEQKAGNEFIFRVTSRPKEATEIAKSICDTYQNEEVNVFACGGDGTCFEVINGLIGSKNVNFGIIPVGSCNDFLKTFPNRPFLKISEQIKSHPIVIDLIKVDDEYSLNVANFGFDAKSNYDQIKYRKVFKSIKKAYNFALLKNILSPKLGDKVEIKVDDKLVFDGKSLLINVANAKYYGGGFKCAPYADCQDNLLEFMVVKKVSPITFLKMVKYYKKGEHLDNPKFKNILKYCRGKKIQIRGKNDKEIVGCLDGETRIKKEFNVEIISNAINFILPDVEINKYQ